jgi:hypothetical protein
MNGVDRQQMLGALVLLVMALFVSGGLPLAVRWRRHLRLAAIAGVVLAAVLALAESVIWWTGQDR